MESLLRETPKVEYSQIKSVAENSINVFVTLNRRFINFLFLFFFLNQSDIHAIKICQERVVLLLWGFFNPRYAGGNFVLRPDLFCDPHFLKDVKVQF